MQKQDTKPIRDSNPKWGETMWFEVGTANTIEVRCSDRSKMLGELADFEIGRVEIKVSELTDLSKKPQDKWFDIPGQKKAKLHLAFFV